MKKGKINPVDAAFEQYQILKEKLKSARDAQEKNMLFRRMVNLLGVVEFLISMNKTS